MKVAVISDIHSNLEALEEVLRDIDRSNVDMIISLGDNIGYGPDPEQVITTLMERRIPSVYGNHEMASLDPVYLQWFNSNAKKALRNNMAQLSETSISFIRSMQASITIDTCHFVHGFPPDSSTTYLFQVPDKTIQTVLKYIPSMFTFVGHTHMLQMIKDDEKKIIRKKLKQGIIPLERTSKYIINAGSVGQPRDMNNNAKYVIIDTYSHKLDVRFIPYDVSRTSKKIKAMNLPQIYAQRLL